ncbi:hypothetical protein CUU66_15695 [Peribacillus deserti]|uniref:Uncharacterized protein n=1 Tax=Peribacillus deserti TaxID=673318 RepID=A0A2N5M3S6_9BACI|nr:hypothetical protein CUU66_15695 [Peribacillus deserti]
MSLYWRLDPAWAIFWLPSCYSRALPGLYAGKCSSAEKPKASIKDRFPLGNQHIPQRKSIKAAV